jgi:AcrR family transcriptional regulator
MESTGQSKRQRLLDAAAAAFSEVGFEGTSIRKIADDAGVSFQLIAHYLGSKDDLWAATVDDLFTRYIETGRGLGFDTQGDVREQFRNHLRLLFTDMIQNPQLRKIWVQEKLANSERYARVVKPMIKRLVDTLAIPYFQEVVRLGIVTRYTPEETLIIWSGIVQGCVTSSSAIELLFQNPIGSSKGIESLVDLTFRALTYPGRDAAGSAGRNGDIQPTDEHIADLRRENDHLKQMVGSAALEIERLSSAVRGPV